jgi:enoyl-CoA hydratase
VNVITAVEGGLGHITLNRPGAINALTLTMVREVRAALVAWERDRGVQVVVIDGAGDRGLCAGADIVALRDAALSGDRMPRVFWREEYQLNAHIARYVKPLVAIMDGIVMGGGVGLSAHARHRIATERLTLAMPEVTIGFAPDVGGTYLLSRAPGELGTHLALTGSRIGANDAILCGLADHHVRTDVLPDLLDLLRLGQLERALALAAPPDPASAPLSRSQSAIDRCYGADDVETILDRLDADPARIAGDAAELIRAQSPTALVVTLRALRSARELPSMRACLQQEFRTSCAFLDTPDYSEGVRAAVVDKDRTPRWNPPDLASVSPDDVERHFRTLGNDELVFD